MLETLTQQPQDKILMLMGMYAADTRAEKIDLGVGVYKDASGGTPVFKAIKEAEHQLWQTETTKSYTGLAGDPAFAAAMRGLILGKAVEADRVDLEPYWGKVRCISLFRRRHLCCRL